jgi:hypothetical protein
MAIDRQPLALLKKRWLRHEEGGKMREVGEVKNRRGCKLKRNKWRKQKKELRKEMHTVRKKKRGRKKDMK